MLAFAGPDELLQDGFSSPTWLHSLPASVHVTRALFGSFLAAYLESGPRHLPRPRSNYLRKSETPHVFPHCKKKLKKLIGMFLGFYINIYIYTYIYIYIFFWLGFYINWLTIFGCSTKFSVVSAMCQCKYSQRSLNWRALRTEAGNAALVRSCFPFSTLWWTNIAIENGHRNSGFSH